MVPLLMLLLLLGIAFWLGKEFSYARRRRAFLETRDSRGRPMLPPHERVTEEQLQVRVRDLRRAVARGDVSLEEATGSLLRFGGPALTPERAHDLLSR